MKITPVPLPEDSAVAALFAGADLADAFAAMVPAGSRLDMDMWADG